MTKSEVVARVWKMTGTKKTDVNKILDAFFETIAYDMSRGNKTKLSNFGSFEVKHREARMGYNMQTKQHMPIPSRNTVVFHPGKMLLDAVKEK